MKRNNNSLLFTIMGGAIFCFVFLGMAFIFTNNTGKQTLRGSNNIPNQIINSSDGEISLGDTQTGCGNSVKLCASDAGTKQSDGKCHKQCEPVDYPSCTSMGGTMYNATCCYDAGTEPTVTKCTSCNYGAYLSGGNCYKCPAGSYCDNSTKTLCPAGSYTAHEGQGGCASCANEDNGRIAYQPLTGQTSCLTCTGNQVANADHTDCVDDHTAPVSCSNGLVLHENESCTVPSNQKCRGGANGSWSTSAINCSFATCAAIECISTNVTYTCNVTYDASSNKVNITASASDSSIRLMKTVINGVETSSLTPQTSGNYTAIAYFSDGGTCQGSANVPVKEVELESLDGGGSAYVTPTANKTFYIHAIGSDGKVMSNVTWTVTPSNASALASQNCSGANCIVVVKAWGCSCTPPTATITVTAKENGYTKTVSTTISVTSYGEWRLVASNVTGDVNSLTLTTALNHAGCDGYNNYNPTTGKYDKYNRCCCGGGGSKSACYAQTACYRKTDNTYIWTDNPENTWTIDSTKKTKAECGETAIPESSYTKYSWTSTPEPTWTPITSITKSTECVKAPRCYSDENGEYHWTNSPEPSWKEEDISKEANCQKEENPACYKDPNGVYQWGKYAKTSGYTLISSINDETSCKNPEQPNYACYKDNNGNYKWTDTQPEGYTKVEGVSNPEDCAEDESPACYLHGNGFIWGKYDKVTGYIRVDGIDKQEDCQTPNEEACYKDKDGKYHWGDYSDDTNYTLVPSVTEKSKCNSEVPVPATGISTSKLIYIFMSILMACGVGFIYYSSVVKKNS